jgi:hypothetical protein
MSQNNPQSAPGGQQQQIQVKVTDEVLKGVYANMVQISHTPEEFIMDFMNIVPPTGIVTSRVFVSPAHMKRIVAALQDNLKRYEAQFGNVQAGEAPVHQVGFRME